MSRQRPNIVLVLADDLGYSDIGCFGGEIRTPALDRLGRGGVRLNAFYNTARCSPSRASLLTGRHPHETGIGVLTEDLSPYGAYPGSLSARFPTIAELVKPAGYATCLAGKWHLSHHTAGPDESWPTRRGFDDFFGIMAGADSYFHPQNLWRNETRLDVPGGGFYLTDAISAHATRFVGSCAQQDQPFFLYLAYNAPHWPLHAHEEDIGSYAGVFEAGWDVLREQRHARMRVEGIVGEESALSERDPTQPAWSRVAHPAWEARRMATYAAQVEAMDRGIGTVLDALEEAGVREDTLVIFLSDNGACAEQIPPPIAPRFFERQPSATPDGRPMAFGNEPGVVLGPDDTFASYGRAWANLSNTPFRLYKRWVHEGGIATPVLAYWPAGGLADGTICESPYQLTDLLPTLLEVAGVAAPSGPGRSMLPELRAEVEASGAEHTLYFEHVGNAAVRRGRWKAVCEADHPWELYDVGLDRSELHDRAADEPAVLAELTAAWQHWAGNVGVVPWDELREIVRVHGG